MPTQIVWADWCISANGVVPGTASQTLYIDDCDPEDEAQLWTVNEQSQTVSNKDGNCITLGRAALGVPVRVVSPLPLRALCGMGIARLMCVFDRLR